MEEERCYTVYMHVNKTNGKTYVGLTCQEPETRWGSNGLGYKNYYYSTQNYFYNAIKKYGWNNFDHIILFENKNKEEAEQLEILYIKVLMSNNKTYGYNISNGGNSIGKHTEETKLKIKISNGRKVICDNKIFETLGVCAEYYNVNAGTMGDWLRGEHSMPINFYKMGLKYLDGDYELRPQDEIQSGKKRKVICEYKIFESISDCARYYNIDSHNMSDWLSGRLNMRRDFYEKGLRFLEGDNEIIQPQNKYHKYRNVVCDDIIFDSIKDCSEYYDVNISTMSCWLVGQNPMSQKFKKLGLRYLNDDMTIYDVQPKDRIREIICDKMIFKTIKECAEFYGVNYGTMRCWLYEQNPIPQRFVNLGLRYLDDETTVFKVQTVSRKKQIICDGKVFETIKDCSIFYGVNYSTMTNWLKDRNPIPKEFKDMGLDYYTEN